MDNHARAVFGTKRILLLGSLFAASLALVLVGTVQATERPSFCSTCHEMTPYHDAWASGAHRSVACVECHVEPGAVNRIAHKFVALREVYDHFATKPRFPMGTAVVPDRRCVRCHDGTIDPGIAGFDHEKHRAGRSCVTCHSEVGHTVTADALADAGVLDATAQAEKEARVVAIAGKGSANLAGHTRVVCSNCHDMAATRCASCHSAPAGHDHGSSCATCHATTSFAFSHPAAGAACQTCHERPADHDPGACATCHEPGDAWRFTHPGSQKCDSCHTRPAKHYNGACTTCHSVGTPFENAVFKHPSANATCTDCHRRPANHASGRCTTCHRPASSWRFYHPASTSCASCHTAPAKHYGSSCSSCHSPGTSWKNAKFDHPGIPGGKHTYKSFACSKCHPNGYSSYSCLACHSSNHPDD